MGFAAACVAAAIGAAIVAALGPGPAHKDFVDAARLSGMSDARIILTKILPNVIPVIVIPMSMTLGWMILETAGPSFLGLGSQPPVADLGSMLGEARAGLITNPHSSIVPGVMILIIVMAIELLDAVRIPNAASCIDDCPQEMSDGMRPCVGSAMALANDPEVVIANEPTIALEVMVQAQILSLLDDLRRERGLANVFITHDFGVVGQFCDRVAVMSAGGIVEQGSRAPSSTCRANPIPRGSWPACRNWARASGGWRPSRACRRPAVPSPPLRPGDRGLSHGCDRARQDGRPRAALPVSGQHDGGRPVTTPALRLDNLSKTFPRGRGLFGPERLGVREIHPVTLYVMPGETLGIVGDSGCGKSTLTRMLVGLLPLTTGTIAIEGAALDDADPAIFGKRIQYVFKDPIR